MEERFKIKLYLSFFIAALILIGISTFPLESGIIFLNRCCGNETALSSYLPALSAWISEVRTGVIETYRKYPFMAYGTDWLGFAHIVIGILFIGPFRDPVRNIWVIEFGMIACILVIPFALVFGHFREIPLFSRLIDCSFGLIGLIPLYQVWKLTKNLERKQTRAADTFSSVKDVP